MACVDSVVVIKTAMQKKNITCVNSPTSTASHSLTKTHIKQETVEDGYDDTTKTRNVDTFSTWGTNIRPRPKTIRKTSTCVVRSRDHKPNDEITKGDSALTAKDKYTTSEQEDEPLEHRKLLLKHGNRFVERKLIFSEQENKLWQEEAMFSEQESKCLKQEVMFSEQESKCLEQEVMFSKQENKFLKQEEMFSEQYNKLWQQEVMFSEHESKLLKQEIMFSEQATGSSDHINYSTENLGDKQSTPVSDTKPDIVYIKPTNHEGESNHSTTEIKAEPADVEDTPTYDCVQSAAPLLDPTLNHCLTCSYTTPSYQDLLHHITATHIAIPGFGMCTRCGRLARREHVQQTTDHAAAFNCALCAFTSDDVGRHASHMAQEHPAGAPASTQSERVFLCASCMDTEVADSAYSCTLCDFATASRERLSQHQVQAHISSRQVHRCDLCGHTHRDRSKVHAHMHARHGPHEGPECACRHISRAPQHRCELCRHFVHSETRVVAEHVRHSHRPRVKCPQCEYRPLCRRSLAVHLSTRHGAPAGVHRCPRCDFTTRRKPDLEAHVRAKHDAAAQMYRCSECEYTSKAKYRLREHVRAKHDAEAQVYECAHCSYSSKTKRNLSRHVKGQHEAGRRFECARCEYLGRGRRDLIAHFKARHR